MSVICNSSFSDVLGSLLM